MATWLDYYVSGAASSAKRSGWHSNGGDDLEAAKMMALAGVSSNLDGPSTPWEKSLKAFQGCVLPFLLSPDDRARIAESEGHSGNILAQPTAYQIPNDIAMSLIQGSVPQTDDWQKLLLQTTFFDYPGGLPIDGSDSIRAVFVQPTKAPGSFLCVAVVTGKHNNSMTGRFAWMFGTEETLGDSVSVADHSVRTTVERLTRLSLLYVLTQRDLGSSIPTLPMRVEGERASAKKERAKAKTHSLFTVHALRAAPSSGSFPNPSAAAGRTLNHLVDVRGHFRWQPWGPKRAKRRLQWIDGHQRGQGDQRIDMTRL